MAPSSSTSPAALQSAVTSRGLCLPVSISYSLSIALRINYWSHPPLCDDHYHYHRLHQRSSASLLHRPRPFLTMTYWRQLILDRSTVLRREPSSGVIQVAKSGEAYPCTIGRRFTWKRCNYLFQGHIMGLLKKTGFFRTLISLSDTKTL
ncbi:hypothetical protein J6590_033859 [Homalodisca vitripennis]|nr:hypothetical protein J6590_033859 [Homalodisca vitripennis]